MSFVRLGGAARLVHIIQHCQYEKLIWTATIALTALTDGHYNNVDNQRDIIAKQIVDCGALQVISRAVMCILTICVRPWHQISITHHNDS
jgi:hypothetical protein